MRWNNIQIHNFTNLIKGTAVLLCLAAPVSTTLAQFSSGLKEGLTFQFDGEERTYDLYVPVSYAGDGTAPLLLDLHGFSSSGSDQRGISGFASLSDTRGFVVAYPDGIGSSWTDRIGLQGNRDDVGFLKALAGALQQEGNLDARRIYATGWSNGGDMTHRLACDAADVFAAYASFAGIILSDWTQADCPASRPFPIVLLRGRTDETVPFGGGNVFGQPIAGAVPTFAFFRQLNQCGPEQVESNPNPGNTTECQIDTSCGAGVQVQFCATQSNVMAGHNLYRSADGVNVSALAWDFMSQFELPETVDSFEINFGLTGGWFNPDTAGQGLLLEVLPDSQQVFVTWFTYDDGSSARSKIGSSDHRWLSGLGSIDGNRVEIDLRVTSGGFFDDPTDVARTPAGGYGTLQLEFHDCENATMTYDISEEGLAGTRELVRLTAPPQACLDLASQ